jgi:creatinine amidohydrolase/Fe(II)-dependent formamide hydrolase-like protein
MAVPLELAESTSAQVGNIAPTLIVPLGSTEQHGPHLPLSVDAAVVGGVVERHGLERGAGRPGPCILERRRLLCLPSLGHWDRQDTRRANHPGRGGLWRCAS